MLVIISEIYPEGVSPRSIRLIESMWSEICLPDQLYSCKSLIMCIWWQFHITATGTIAYDMIKKIFHTQLCFLLECFPSFISYLSVLFSGLFFLALISPLFYSFSNLLRHLMDLVMLSEVTGSRHSKVVQVPGLTSNILT
jgi:hypothetical protein